MNEQVETGCCPRFNPEPWDETEVSWVDKAFLQDRVFCFFRIPINMGSVMKRNMAKVEEAQAADTETVVLYECRSMWSANVYISVGRDIPGADMTRISGDFLTKVYEGPYKECGNWAKSMQEYVEAKSQVSEKIYFYFTTCPKCAEAYGENYTVLFSKLPDAV